MKRQNNVSTVNAMDDKTKKTLLLVGVGVAGVVGAYVLSSRKSTPSNAQTPTSVNMPNASSGVVPIPALLAQSAQRPNTLTPSAPIPANAQTPQPIPQQNSLQDFWSRFGLKPFSSGNPDFDKSYTAQLEIGGNRAITVPTYVVDKTTLLQHLNIVSEKYSDDVSRPLVQQTIQRVQAIN